SINLAQAVNLLCYEWFQQRAESEASAGESVDELAPRGEVESMYDHLLRTMLHIGYTDEFRKGAVEHIYRRVFDRAQLTSREVSALRGLWRQTLWAADQEPARIPGNN